MLGLLTYVYHRIYWTPWFNEAGELQQSVLHLSPQGQWTPHPARKSRAGRWKVSKANRFKLQNAYFQVGTEEPMSHIHTYLRMLESPHRWSPARSRPLLCFPPQADQSKQTLGMFSCATPGSTQSQDNSAVLSQSVCNLFLLPHWKEYLLTSQSQSVVVCICRVHHLYISII